jgi:hypothetical protein
MKTLGIAVLVAVLSLTLGLGVGAVKAEVGADLSFKEALVKYVGDALLSKMMGNDDNPLGSSVYNRLVSFDEGIAVDGTTVIDGSGNWDGAITGTSATLSSTLAVTGATTLTGALTANGAVAASSTLQVTGATTLYGATEVAGQLTLSGAAGSVTSTVAGSTAFDTSTLYVDAVNNRVGVGTSTPDVTLHVENSGATTTLQVGSNGATGQGSCLELEAADGTKMYLYASSTISAAAPWTGLNLSTTACN